MQLNFVGRNIEITAALKDFATEKLSSLNKLHQNITHVHVILQVEKATQKAEATVHISGAEIFAESKTDDMYKSIEELADKLLIQITKHKEKITDHR